MDSDIQFHEHCLICSGSDLKRLKDFGHAFLVKCGNCGFVFCERIPGADELQRHYNNYPQTASISPITTKRYEELLERFEPYRKTNNILDIGFGDGFFLDVAKSRGWNVYGTEYSETLALKGVSKGINVKQGKFDSKWFESNFFDVITYIEVLEHINSPKKEIPLFIEVLRKGGVFYLTTPNFNSISRSLLKANWSIIEYPEHLCYYTPQTMRKLFSRFPQVGVEKIITTGFSISRLTERTRLKRQETKEFNSYPIDEKLRNSMEHNKVLGLLKRTLNSILTIFGRGDTIKATFVKM